MTPKELAEECMKSIRLTQELGLEISLQHPGVILKVPKKKAPEGQSIRFFGRVKAVILSVDRAPYPERGYIVNCAPGALDVLVYLHSQGVVTIEILPELEARKAA